MNASLRQQLEKQVGRPLTDDEWETFKRLQLEAATGESSTAAGDESRGVVARTARSVAALIGAVIVAFLVGTAVTIVVVAMLLGLLWAYSPGTLDSAGEDDAVSVYDALGFVFAEAFVGLLVMSYWSLARLLLGLGLGVGLIALAIGAVIRVVGG
jgi:hypothetical protein